MYSKVSLTSSKGTNWNTDNRDAQLWVLYSVVTYSGIRHKEDVFHHGDYTVTSAFDRSFCITLIFAISKFIMQ